MTKRTVRETVKEYDFGYLTDRLEEILKKEVEEK